MLKPHFHASPDLFIQILTKPVKKKKTPSRNVSNESSKRVSIDTTQNEVHIYERESYEVKSTRV
jgi:hypothetical protein